MNPVYTITDIFYTLQGEGLRMGAPSVFIRFTGCNLWNGRSEGRTQGRGACARWCDSDFLRGEKYTAQEIIHRVYSLWPRGSSLPWVVLTGGEPLLQVDVKLIEHLRAANINISIETNGTVDVGYLSLTQHVTLSPKLHAPLVLSPHVVSEMKIILPGDIDGNSGWNLDTLHSLAIRYATSQLYVQPQDPLLSTKVGDTYLSNVFSKVGPSEKIFERRFSTYQKHLQQCIDFVRQHPPWRLSLQTHKYVQIP